MSFTYKFTFTLCLISLFSISSFAQRDSSQIELNIFPNPNKGTFYITLVKHEAVYSKLYSMDGRLYKTLYLQEGLNYISIDVPAGIYILRIDEEGENQDFKITFS